MDELNLPLLRADLANDLCSFQPSATSSFHLPTMHKDPIVPFQSLGARVARFGDGEARPVGFLAELSPVVSNGVTKRHPQSIRSPSCIDTKRKKISMHDRDIRGRDRKGTVFRSTLPFSPINDSGLNGDSPSDRCRETGPCTVFSRSFRGLPRVDKAPVGMARGRGKDFPPRS